MLARLFGARVATAQAGAARGFFGVAQRRAPMGGIVGTNKNTESAKDGDASDDASVATGADGQDRFERQPARRGAATDADGAAETTKATQADKASRASNFGADRVLPGTGAAGC